MLLEINVQAKPKTLIPVCIRDYVINKYKVGSRYICTPEPLDSDIDILIYAYAKNKPVVHVLLTEDGWEIDGNYPVNEEGFVSYRKGDINLIFVFQSLHYYRFLYATEACKVLNLQDKAQRIKMHDHFKDLDITKEVNI